MKYITAILLLLISVQLINAQTTFSKASESDPAATAVLEKVRAKYESYQTMEANFSMTIEFPEEPKDVQKGHILQEGDKYRLDFESQTMVSDGETLWLHLKAAEEVQINDVDNDEGELMSPSAMFKFYESEDFVYALTNEMSENGRVVQQIEFKPLDEDSEYTKIRLTIDKKTDEVIRMKSFGKDGARYTLTIDKIIANQSIPTGTFTFNKSECSDCYYEDLRM